MRSFAPSCGMMMYGWCRLYLMDGTIPKVAIQGLLHYCIGEQA